VRKIENTAKKRETVKKIKNTEFMHFSSDVAVLPGHEVMITRRPQVRDFYGDRLAVPDTIARWFDIVDVKVGNRSQMPGASSISAELCGVRLDKRARLAVRKGELRVSRAARAAFGLVFPMEPCRMSFDLVITARMKDTTDPACEAGKVFELIILGR